MGCVVPDPPLGEPKESGEKEKCLQRRNLDSMISGPHSRVLEAEALGEGGGGVGGGWGRGDLHLCCRQIWAPSHLRICVMRTGHLCWGVRWGGEP